MYNQINADTLTKAGQFALSDIQLISYQSSDGGSEPKKVSVRSLVLEINIYEDIFSKGLSGNVVLLDGQNLTNHLPLTGFERIEFKLNTPGIAKGFDFTSTTGHPMYIYKISGRQEMTPRTEARKRLTEVTKEVVLEIENELEIALLIQSSTRSCKAYIELLTVSIIDPSSSLDVFESSSNTSSESLYVSASAIDDCNISTFEFNVAISVILS